MSSAIGNIYVKMQMWLNVQFIPKFYPLEVRQVCTLPGTRLGNYIYDSF